MRLHRATLNQVSIDIKKGITEKGNNTNLLQFPHGSHVVLELVQAPECGDSQLCVLNPHLQLTSLLQVLSIRALVSTTGENGTCVCEYIYSGILSVTSVGFQILILA